MPSAKKVFFEKLAFHIATGVYEPAEDSFLFADNLKVGPNDTVIDIGTGCGLLAIISATKAQEVFAIDVSPWAIHCARENAILNHVARKMVFIQGDLLGSFRPSQMFDLILFNAPYLPSGKTEGKSWNSRAWAGGPEGRDTINRFIRQLPAHLSRKGRALLMQSTLSDVGETMKMFGQEDLAATIVATRALPFFETIVLLEAKYA